MKMIGELNGKWAILFKVSLVLMPIFTGVIITWGTWTTSRIYNHDIEIARIRAFIDQGPRFTANDAQALELRVISRIADSNERKFSELLGKLQLLTDSITELKVKLASHIAREEKVSP
jgi:hypothetical protein